MSEKKRKRCGVVKKSIALILLLLGVSLLIVGIQGTLRLYNMGGYYTSGEELADLFLEEQMADVARVTLKKYATGTPSEATRFAKENYCSYIIKRNGSFLAGDADWDCVWSKTYQFGQYEEGRYMFAGVRDYSITLYLQKVSFTDGIWWNYNLALYSEVLRVVLPVMVAVGILLVIGNFVFLLKKIGWCPQSENVTSGRFGKVPADLFTVIVSGLILCWIWFINCMVEICGGIALDIVAFYGILIFALLWILSMVARNKARELWKTSFFAFLFKKSKVGIIRLMKVLAKLPLIWKTVCIAGVICLVEFVFIQIMYACYPLPGSMYVLWLVFWSVEKVILLTFFFWMVFQLRTLKRAGKALAEGNLKYQVREEEFFADLKEHAQHLNRISEGVNLAVQERMKSEHFKTELITNVSHDIKTPLTSIINYSDLLSKEECDNEKITEYAQTIKRQSDRLKKLIEDLVEASKASSGSMEVHMEECEVEVLLEQAVGEFAGKLAEKDMDVITKATQAPTMIMADGRLLWRVFDNLLNNICKYAQSATRVYLSVEQASGTAVITFKNISEFPLDITEEELMERFVRGDKSRHTEGNGLGLNIAKSLVELQKGTMQLVIDGDLFKVILSFPLLEK